MSFFVLLPLVLLSSLGAEGKFLIFQFPIQFVSIPEALWRPKKKGEVPWLRAAGYFMKRESM
jgi:hypothetical protein